MILLLFAMLLAILWVLVPFAVFGIKGLLKQLILEQRRTNALLAGKDSQGVAPVATDADKPTLKNILAEIRKA
ncbi:hypothetical protein [Stenotrophomonas maltophilia]|uniref:hypothetical protein n=1 Tax=Stenotrophomonas maltophilia TaxID=40324 RepID=UPI0021D979AE|nr:hypothetical protein [Stenotrophomonas maltophilia]UXY46995.1 hypothetical protein N8888_11435 [Stenotrophomonas maltophilia]